MFSKILEEMLHCKRHFFKKNGTNYENIIDEEKIEEKKRKKYNNIM